MEEAVQEKSQEQVLSETNADLVSFVQTYQQRVADLEFQVIQKDRLNEKLQDRIGQLERDAAMEALQGEIIEPPKKQL